MGFVLERQGKFIHSRMCRKKIFSTGFWRILWKEFFPQPIHPHSTAPVDTGSACRQCARQLSTNRYFPDPPGIGGLPKPPLPKGGASATPRRGDNGLAAFYIGLYFGKVPAVESLSRLRRQLPLTREPFCARYRRAVPAANFAR